MTLRVSTNVNLVGGFMSKWTVGVRFGNPKLKKLRRENLSSEQMRKLDLRVQGLVDDGLEMARVKRSGRKKPFKS